MAAFLLPPLHSWAPAPAQLPITQAQAGAERLGQLPGGAAQAGSAPEARAGPPWRHGGEGGAIVVGAPLRRRGGGEPAGGGAEDGAATGGGESGSGGAVAGPALRRRGGGEPAGGGMAESAGGEDWDAQADLHPSPVRSERSAWSGRSDAEGYQPVLLAGGQRLSKVSAPCCAFCRSRVSGPSARVLLAGVQRLSKVSAPCSASTGPASQGVDHPQAPAGCPSCTFLSLALLRRGKGAQCRIVCTPCCRSGQSCLQQCVRVFVCACS